MTSPTMTHEELVAQHARRLAEVAAYIEEVADFAGYCADIEGCALDAPETLAAKVRTDPAMYEWYRREMEGWPVREAAACQ